MSWCKTDQSDFLVNFFLLLTSKCLNFASAFQFKRKTFSCIFLAEMLLFCLAVFIVHALIFCPHFSVKQSATQPKKYSGMFNFSKLKSTCKNSGTFEGINSPEKVT